MAEMQSTYNIDNINNAWYVVNIYISYSESTDV